jgi:hypothetical protein
VTAEPQPDPTVQEHAKALEDDLKALAAVPDTQDANEIPERQQRLLDNFNKLVALSMASNPPRDPQVDNSAAWDFAKKTFEQNLVMLVNAVYGRDRDEIKLRANLLREELNALLGDL